MKPKIVTLCFLMVGWLSLQAADAAFWQFGNGGTGGFKSSGEQLKLANESGKLVLTMEKNSGVKMMQSRTVFLPKSDQLQIICLTGEMQTDALTAGRFDVKILRGFKGGQAFLEPALSLCQFKSGKFRKCWVLPKDSLSAVVFFVFDKESAGKVLLQNMKVEVLKYDEKLLAEKLPEQAKILFKKNFKEGIAGLNVNNPVVKLQKSQKGLIIDFGAPDKKGKSVIFPSVSLPSIAQGFQGELIITLKGYPVTFQGRRLDVKPLFSSGKQVNFPPPYPSMLKGGTVTGKWTFDSQQKSISLFLATDGEAMGEYVIEEIIIEVVAESANHITTGFPSNIVPKESAVVSVTPFLADKMSAGTVTVKDESGCVLQKADLRDEGTSVTLPERGYYLIVAETTYPDRKIQTEKSVVVAGNPLPPAVIEKSRYGVVGVNSNTDLLRAVGSRWNWKFTGFSGVNLLQGGALQPAQEWNDFPGDQSIINIYTAGDLPSFIQPGVNGSTVITFPSDVNVYNKLIRLFASSPNFPRYFNVFNEPEGKWRGSLDDLVRWHILTRNAIKAVNPQCVVLAPGSCNINMHLVRKLGDLGLFTTMDGICIHPYVAGTAPEKEFIERIDDFEEYLKTAGLAEKPLFYTEFGWTTEKGGWQPPVTVHVQASYVSRSLALLGTTSMTGCAYFALQYRNVNPGEEGFSLINPDGTPKLGLAALTASFRHLGATLPQKGIRFSFSPTLFMTAFETTSGEMLVCAWNTTGKAPFTPPFPIERSYSMTGRQLKCFPGEVSENPVYLYSSDRSLLTPVFHPAIKLLAGESTALKLKEPFLFPPLNSSADKVSAAVDAQTGKYLILDRADGKWHVYPINIPGAIEFKSAVLHYPPDHSPEMEITFHSNFNEIREFCLKGNFNGMDLRTNPVQVNPDSDFTQKLIIPEHVALLGGSLRFHAQEKGGKISLPVKREIALLPVSRFDQGKGWNAIRKTTWKNFPAFDSHNPFRGSFAPEECSAELQCAYDDQALLIRVEVQDDQHCQTKSAGDIWQEDSLQLAFDIDSEKPFEPNSQFGFNGHRILEYGFSCGPSGKTIWRHHSYIPELKDNLPEPRIAFEFNRVGDRSVYVICFPWATLGLAKVPQPGSEFGIAALLNDKDALRSRHGLRFFYGIHPDKEPELYGKMFFR